MLPTHRIELLPGGGWKVTQLSSTLSLAAQQTASTHAGPPARLMLKAPITWIRGEDFDMEGQLGELFKEREVKSGRRMTTTSIFRRSQLLTSSSAT